MSRAEASNELTEDIPPQLLPEALAAFARQTGLQVIYVSEIARGHASKGSPAGLTASAALTRLLDGTGLRFEFLTARGVRIVAAAGPSRPASEHAARPLRHDQGSAGTLATLEEVVVSAAQRDERLSRVPLSIAVWTQQAVQASGARDIAAIANLTPGVEFEAYPDYGPGIETNIAIRGVNAKDGSTTAVYIDDTPIPHDRASVWGRAYPVLFDLERIEVLRGPQGVLMGEGAEGGAVRFITTQPSLTTWSGFARSEAATTTRGAPSYEYGAAAGGPVISEVAGFRVGVWLRRDGGYVNRVDPFTGATVDPNANWARTEVLRAAITIAPTAAIQITPLINYQSIHVDDSSAFYTYLSDPSRGLLHNGKLLEQWDNDRTCLATLRISVALGAAIDLSATSAYFRRQAFALQDQTNISGWNWPNPMGGEYPVSYADAKPDGEPFEQHTVSQQVRLSSSDPAARLRWLAGIGYVHAHDRADQDIVTTALADGGSVSGNTRPDRMTIQVAAYGQVDWRLQERLTATAGLRVERASYNSVVVLRDTPDPAVFQVFQVTGHATPTAPRLALSFQPDASNLYYASVAKGYRMGGPNVQVGFYCGVTTPPAYGPDAVWTYELGAKKELLGSRLQINSSLFHTRWRDVQTQIPVPDCGIAYTTNAGAATSNGFDLAGQALLTELEGGPDRGVCGRSLH